ncbi:predicted protein [Sclerotinia sclerotiorum 1980 UF-70]|uniref:Uncharacterized protein n=1 Tax=Sclerotinia sclerotiorum (strain ATCC 18683 / 1980 / Ss-1) TaxID=665079 RepID=A7EQB1_SCLS1|nr:predicted protein [Sclerotinia sclerotiorum 1980 UF-70]EDO05027.1 predicted protein [Sclerotinia sclerotiorum 1980 UF-70]
MPWYSSLAESDDGINCVWLKESFSRLQTNPRGASESAVSMLYPSHFACIGEFPAFDVPRSNSQGYWCKSVVFFGAQTATVE